MLAKNDDGGENRNFLLEYNLTQENTYYIEARMYTSTTGTFTMTSTRNIPKVSGVQIGGRAGDALRLNWNKTSSAAGYIIEQYKSGQWVRIARIANNSTTTYRWRTSALYYLSIPDTGLWF